MLKHIYPNIKIAYEWDWIDVEWCIYFSPEYIDDNWIFWNLRKIIEKRFKNYTGEDLIILPMEDVFYPERYYANGKKPNNITLWEECTINPYSQPDFNDFWRYKRFDYNAAIMKDWELKEKELAYHKESYGPFHIDGDLATLIKNLRGDE
jgi:hypothetical protein